MNTRLKCMRAIGLGLVGLLIAMTSVRANWIGVSDTTIKIGNLMPYSGPASAYSLIGEVEAAYFKMINDRGGVCGRKIEFISYDDGYSPPKAVEHARKLVESDEVLLIFSTLGTPPSVAIRSYMGARKVPQLVVASGAPVFSDHEKYPWTMGWQADYATETQVYISYITRVHPGARVGILYQNDDYGRAYRDALRASVMGSKFTIVSEQTYAVSDPTIDSQMANLKASGADVFINASTAKFAAQSIRKAAELDWKPIHLLANPSSSVGAVLTPAGLDLSKGIISAGFLKDPSDPRWAGDEKARQWNEFIDRYIPRADKKSYFSVIGHAFSQTLVHILSSTCSDLSREGVLRAATNIKDLQLDMVLPGITLKTGPDDYRPMTQLQLMRFNGERWELFGDIISGDQR